MGISSLEIPCEKRLNKSANIIVMEKKVQGSKEWMNYIQGGDATDGQCMFSSESYYDSFWEDAAHGVAIISEGGEVIDANPAFCHLLGLLYGKACGLNIRDFVADGAWRDDMRTIDNISLGKQGSITTEERWNKNLNPNGPYIPVRVRAVRIPSERTAPFKHLVLHVYDLRSVRYDMQGNNWSNKTMPELMKELLMTHFGKIAVLIVTLIFCLALNGSLGETIDKIIESQTKNEPKIQYIQVPQQTHTPPTPAPESEKQ